MLLPVIFCTSMSATALGLLVATMVRSESQVSAYATILVITMGGVSGCFTPRKWLPDAMREFSLTTPHAWSLMAYEELLCKAAPDPHAGVRVLHHAGRVLSRLLHRRQRAVPVVRMIGTTEPVSVASLGVPWRP